MPQLAKLPKKKLNSGPPKKEAVNSDETKKEKETSPRLFKKKSKKNVGYNRLPVLFQLMEEDPDATNLIMNRGAAGKKVISGQATTAISGWAMLATAMNKVGKEARAGEIDGSFSSEICVC
jgi:hypothetical protein